MAVLAPGWEKDYEGRPHSAVSSLFVQDCDSPSNRRRQLQRAVVGLKRIEIVAELPPGSHFVRREVRLHHDDHSDDFERYARHAAKGAVRAVQANPAAEAPRPTSNSISYWASTFVGDARLIWWHIRLTWELKQRAALLAEANVDRRVELLLFEYCGAGARPGVARSFPPDFSVN